MALKGKAIAVATTDTTLYTCPATIESSVHGLVISNPTAGALTFQLKLYKAELGTTVTVGPAKSVAANDVYTWPKPINLNAGDYIIGVGSGSGLVALYSAYEGSATPAAVGFTGRGAWSSGATYAVNDVVTYNGSSYLAIQAGTNQNPASATAYWMVLASKGDAGTGDVTTNTAQTITGKKTFDGSGALSAKFDNTLENNTISATAATGTINYDILTQSLLYYTTNASGNFTLNFRGDGSNTLNSLMATGETITVSFWNTNGSTAYYNSAVQVDGSAVTPKWLGGSAPSAGNASSIDVYTYAITKTANATFTVLASQSKFA